MKDIAEELLLQKHERKIGVWKASDICYILPPVSPTPLKYYLSSPFFKKIMSLIIRANLMTYARERDLKCS